MECMWSCGLHGKGSNLAATGSGMRVCILTSAHLASDVRIFYKQARTLSAAGYDVTLIAGHDKDETIDNVKIISLPKTRTRLQRMIGLTFRVLRLALKERADVYHLHDPELMLAGMLLKLRSVEVVYDIHENVKEQILNKTWIPGFCRKAVAGMYVRLEAVALKFIDHIIIAEDSYIENYRDHHNLSIIRNYALLEYCEVGKQHMPDHQADPKVLIYVGGIAKIRGGIKMIESLNVLRSHGCMNVHLRLIGPIPSDLEREFSQLIERYELASHISLPGRINHEEVYDELIKAHIGLAILHPEPNYVESLPTKLFEYMSVGLPVITSNFPLWKEIVEGNNCGLTVDPMNPEEIAGAIQYLLERPELMEEMGKNGCRAVLERYNWEEESSKLLDLYAELARK